MLAAMAFDLNEPLLALAAVLIAGIVGGELVGRFHLPKVTGWIGTGILLRAFDIEGLHASDEGLDRFLPFMHFVLGFIAFTVGAALHFKKLRNARTRLGLIALGEILITPTLVYLVLHFIGGLSSEASMLLGAIAIAGAPGTTVVVVQEARAKGIMTRTLVSALALIDMVAVGVFVFVLAILTTQTGGVNNGVIAVALQFGKAFLIGTGTVMIAIGLYRFGVVGPAFLGPSFVFVILASWGAAAFFQVSGILACTIAGIAITNLQHDAVRSIEAYLSHGASVLFAAFFTLAGMRLDFSLVVNVAGLVALYFLARFFAKYISAYTAMSISGAPTPVRNFLGIALMPHGGVAVGLILLVQEAYGVSNPELANQITTVGLATLAINQLLGPSAARFGLQWAGEAGLDRKRLLDFLDEQHIAVGLKGSNKEEIIRSLTSQLYSVSQLPLTQEEFVEKVLEREHLETSCLGEGLMIPHTIIETGDEVTGILGLSSEGLELDAPDGRPVHAVLLLATPEADRERHLEVLAAFASAITKDLNLREQLYHGRSAAHAYSVLHAEEAEDLNYFLEDAFEKVGAFEKE
ncbi:MAG: cation:proton antiporter [Pirellulaceae bacterium]|nr:cation:proton antiporter [Pirellulaceae bacterium]